MIRTLRDGRWCTPTRLRIYPMIMLAVSVVGLVLLVATSDGLMDVMRRPLGTDFSQVWVAGRSVLAGHAATPFEPALHAAAQRAVFGADAPFFGWHYPPYFLGVAALLALLPYLAALAVWQAATLALYLTSIGAILRDTSWPPLFRRRGLDILVPACAFPAVFVNLTHGHNGFLTAALLGSGLLLLRRRPVLAGVLLALLAYKPQFALIVPVALLAGGHWRTIAAGVATLAAMTLATLLVFGIEAWRAFGDSLVFTRTVVLEEGNTGWAKIQSTFSAVRMLGGGIDLAYGVQFAATGAILAVVALVWRSNADDRLKAALVLVGCLLTTPYCLDYDMMILAPAMAFVLSHGFERGFEPWDNTVLAAIWLVPLLARVVAQATSVPLGLIVMVAFFIIVARRSLPFAVPFRPASIGTA